MAKEKSVAFITLGCKVNIAETEGMKRLFEKAGYRIVDSDEFADVYVVNTCTVTNMGDRKSRQMLRRVHTINPDAVVAAVGCFAQVSPEEAAKVEGVSLVVGNNMKHEIVSLVEQAAGSGKGIHVRDRQQLDEFEELPVETYTGHTRAFIKVQDGCDSFCAYCIIPYARGPVRSRRMEDVLREAKGFARQGFKEIVLTGIHLTSFRDNDTGADLVDLTRKISRVDGIERIRLGSLAPEFITPRVIEFARDTPKLCPHFHVSLQSGSAATLKRMNRKYTPDDYRRVVNAIKEAIPDAAITTDVMVGFPGETQQEFEESLAFCDEMEFLWTHVFKYSPRKGTPAAGFKDQVSPGEKEKRSNEMIALAEKNREKFYRRFTGTCPKVLFEQPVSGSPGLVEGLTANYIPVEAELDESVIGEILPVRLAGIRGERMRGVL
ncbi:MAG: tRNA (N(6)-L-threonylcarbamoyladenosine(37)-C(2))-methylthiotransferase MtaB [Clostridiaceae bacterium]|nr:tRNA (N(6)-L-threonylcarbamoyladenosine(37)-C(2))-methylthiotransferase MtaB [Clostridiaceae bacterium]